MINSYSHVSCIADLLMSPVQLAATLLLSLREACGNWAHRIAACTPPSSRLAL